MLKRWKEKKKYYQLKQKILSLQSLHHPRIGILWNRGLGDIPLGLCATIYTIKKLLPPASITFLTRKDLEEGFSLVPGIHTSILPCKRGEKIEISTLPSFDLLIENLDPTLEMAWQRGRFIPKLQWDKSLDSLSSSLHLPQQAIGVHLHSETTYGYEKNWPEEKFKQLFSRFSTPIFLFGLHQKEPFAFPHVIDLRGKLGLLQTLAVIKNHCSVFVGPDSGLINMLYYLDVPFPLKLISLWADARQGIFRQAVVSPNPLLYHIPLLSSDTKSVAPLSVDLVYKTIKG